MQAPPPSNEDPHRCEALEAELRETVARLNRVQEELNWKSAFLEAQVNSTIDGIIVVDPQGRKILQNQRAADLFQIPRHIVDDPDDTLQVQWVMDMTMHPDRFIEKVVHLYSHPDEISHDEIELKNGTVLDRYSSPVTGKDGTRYGRIWTFHDITKRKQVEAALLDREEQLRAAIWASGTGTFRWDIGSNELSWDEALDALFGMPPGQTVRSLENFIATVHPDDRAGVIERCERCAKEGADFDMEFRVLWPDGSLHWLDDKGKTSFDDTGKPIYMTGACVDITARKGVTEALRSSEAEFRLMAEAMPQIVWITRSDGQNIYFSQKWMDYTGLSLEESLGHGWNTPFHPDDQQRAWDAWQHAMATVGTYSIECRLRRADGDYRWWLIRGVPHQDDTGHILKWFGTCTDIHDLKLVEQEIFHANTALRDSEEKFRQLADNITDVFWITSPDFKTIHFISAGYEMLWGRSAASLYANPHQWVESILPEERDGAIAVFATLMSDAAEVSVEYRIARPDGSVRWIHDRGFQVRDATGKLIRFTGIASDITERKRSEEALRESEERFAGAFEHAPIGVALASPEGRWLKVNRALCRLVGYTEDELLTRSFQDITCPEDLPDSLECVRQLIAGEVRSYQSEKRYIHAAGHLVTILLNVSLVRDAQHQPRYFIAQIQDISERKRTEESLRLLSSAVKQSKESIMITEADLDLPGPKIIFVNPAFTQMTGYAAAEVLGMTPRILQGPRTDRAVLDRLRHNLEQGDVFAGEAVNYRKDGTAFDLEWQIAPLRNASSTITHFVAIQRDITERKRLEAQLIQSQKLETVGKLAGGVAHEFNSLLTAIIGQSELLLADLPAGSPLTSKVTEINHAAGRAAILTRQLLAYGRKQTLQPVMLNLNTVLAGMAGTLRHLVGHAIDIRSVPAAGLRTVTADAGQISQVIMNMVINAHDAMPGGGKLTLETANVTLDQASVGSYPELKSGDYVMLAISDTGRGMSPAVQARVFEPFFSTKGVGEGTGLGLSTCYGIIKQSGGHITVYSEPNLGTTFKIYLPQGAATPVNPPQRSVSPGLPGGTETVLLVEDEPSLREMAGALLQRLGYTVLTAANGIEALGLLDAHHTGHIELLFTDVVMPQMSGMELAERVRALSPNIRTLFTSAYTENAIVHKGGLSQGVVLLQKPYTPAALAQKLREVLDQPLPVLQTGSRSLS